MFLSTDISSHHTYHSLLYAVYLGFEQVLLRSAFSHAVALKVLLAPEDTFSFQVRKVRIIGLFLSSFANDLTVIDS
jgi:hypothetical protein